MSDPKFRIRRLRAKKLLDFGVRACKEQMAQGGTFVFEHPLSAESWREVALYNLARADGVYAAKGDQCQWGLVDREGQLMKKPTKFLTNSQPIATTLSQRCKGDHVHQHILGGTKGGSRSQAVQVYPDRLIDAILESYKGQLKGISQIQVHYMNYESPTVSDLDEVPTTDHIDRIRDLYPVNGRGRASTRRRCGGARCGCGATAGARGKNRTGALLSCYESFGRRTTGWVTQTTRDS